MSKRSRDTYDAILGKLRAFGSTYPGAHAKSPWPGHNDLAVNNKTFAYLSAEGDPFSISVKLPIQDTRRSNYRSSSQPAMASARAAGSPSNRARDRCLRSTCSNRGLTKATVRKHRRNSPAASPARMGLRDRRRPRIRETATSPPRSRSWMAGIGIFCRANRAECVGYQG